MLDQHGFLMTNTLQDNLEDLAETLNALDSCKNKKESQGGCKETYQTLLTL